MAGLTVTTTGGAVEGTAAAGGVEAFLGIPYAAPPVGDLRWRAPAPPAPWAGARDASRPGPPCLQGSPDDGGLGAASNEDCLYLNVFRPEFRSGPASGGDRGGGSGRGSLPVMVWIHGGGFVGGSAVDLDSTRLVAGSREAGTPVIVVSVNYRLGALGYLALPALNAESGGDAGTYATQDLTAALRWVRDNAAAFGGDPANVTIFGESAGAMNVCALLASPPAFGLYHRAVTQSGPCTWPFPSMAHAEQTGAALAQRLGCTDPGTVPACLRARPARDVLTAAGTQADILSDHPWAPAIGGPTLPKPVPEAVQAGAWAGVPTIVGTVRDEGRGFTGLWQADGPFTDDRFVGMVHHYFPGRADTVLAAYPPGSAPPRELLARVITDSVFTCPAHATATLLAAAGVPVYTYEFDLPDQPPVADGVLPGATHAWELRFLFPPADSADLTTPAHRALSRNMIGYWARFAATGNPNLQPGAPGGKPAGTPAWPRWSATPDNAGSRMLLLTPEEIRVMGGGDAAEAHHCDIWR